MELARVHGDSSVLILYADYIRLKPDWEQTSRGEEAEESLKFLLEKEQ